LKVNNRKDFLTMEQWKENVLEEFRNLDTKINNLISFLDKNKHHEDYYLLCKQLSLMIDYRECLVKRISKYDAK
jgi:hypothetical protein